MSMSFNKLLLHAGVLLVGVAAPFVFPAYTSQIAMMWLMVVFAMTWDLQGGQMGYNSLGNIFFFGIGMYICTIVQISMFVDLGDYTAHSGSARLDLTLTQFLTGLGVGLIVAAIGAMLLAVVFGWIVFGLRGPYFAIGTLGVAIAAGELIGTWDLVGGGGGISLPPFPGEADGTLFYYFMMLGLAIATFLFLRWLYTTSFLLAINAIRDDEEKAEGMGIQTKRYKTVSWSISAFFLGISGGLFGNMIGFVEPLEVAFPTITFGIFMVLMALLGGKGTLWGPIIGAILFHVIKEVTWTYLLGWQWVTLGALIVINVVFFQQGIVGWMQDKWPEKFGIEVDDPDAAEKETA